MFSWGWGIHLKITSIMSFMFCWSYQFCSRAIAVPSRNVCVFLPINNPKPLAILCITPSRNKWSWVGALLVKNSTRFIQCSIDFSELHVDCYSFGLWDNKWCVVGIQNQSKEFYNNCLQLFVRILNRALLFWFYKTWVFEYDKWWEKLNLYKGRNYFKL